MSCMNWYTLIFCPRIDKGLGKLYELCDSTAKAVGQLADQYEAVDKMKPEVSLATQNINNIIRNLPQGKKKTLENSTLQG